MKQQSLFADLPAVQTSNTPSQKRGISSHESRAIDNDEWLTPRSILKPLGKFDLDPCSPIVRPWDTAEHHYNKTQDGLSQPWFGRVWLNPPYGEKTKHWLKRLVMHANGISLTYARTENRWFQNYIWNEADAVFFLGHRLHFHYVDGRRAKDVGGAGVALAAYGRENAEILRESGLSGKFVPLKTVNIIVVGISPTWLKIISIAVSKTGDEDLKEIYAMVAAIAPDKVAKNQHWKAKIRQQIQIIRKRTFA